jgi:subtilisin family serine protease
MLFLLLGCNQNDNINKVDNNISLNSNTIHQEWHFIYDEEFYHFNKIDKKAHIHAKNSIQKYSGKGIKIAVIDDSLDTLHPKMIEHISQTYNVVDDSSDVSPKKEHSHGTAVSGIIVSDTKKGIRGIAPNVELLFISIPDILSDAHVISAFDFAYQNGADIISCSWGTNNVSNIVKEKIRLVAKKGREGKGISIIFAVGNKGEEIRNDESAIEEVIAIGSTNKYVKVPFYSNYGKALDFVAPGGEYIGIPTLDINSDAGFNFSDYLLYNDKNAFIGTSASAPIVSATIALMLEKNPELTREDIYEILKQSCDKIDEHNITVHDILSGYGKINVDNALSQIVEL